MTTIEQARQIEQRLRGYCTQSANTIAALCAELESAQRDAETKFVKAADRHNLMVVKTAGGYVLMDKGVVTAVGGTK
jgi:hypothetical protein